jgi:hypothetical protein
MGTRSGSGGCCEGQLADTTRGGEGPVDETAADSAATGTSGLGESDGEETNAVDDPWLLCDAASIPELPADAGPCPGLVPAGELDGVQAEAIFGRATHELDHIGDVVRDGAEDSG